MQSNKQSLVIFNAIFFAAVMLLMAYLFPKEQNGMMINHFLIAVWFSVNSYLVQRNAKH
ncbi:MAG: hypothetical protein KUG78_16470 [Kangiellaceae bacterium]|nr:hypothetical protein [Kangiellaceae bacterium]